MKTPTAAQIKARVKRVLLGGYSTPWMILLGHANIKSLPVIDVGIAVRELIAEGVVRVEDAGSNNPSYCPLQGPFKN